jgi:hypothetical protein
MLRAHLVVLASLAVLLPVACSSAKSSATRTDASTKPDATSDGTAGGAAMAVGVVVDTTLAPLAGATVTVAGRTVTTGTDGSFKLAVPASKSEAFAFRKTGYVGRTLPYGVAAGQELQIYVEMLPESSPQPLDATSGGTVMGPRGSSLTIAPNSLVDSAGELVTGMVLVSLTPIDPSVPAQLAAYPGSLEAVNSAGKEGYLLTHGVLEIQVTQGTETLNLKPGAMAAALIPAPSGEASPPATIATWSLNETSGVWQEEQGTATLDAGTHLYALSLPHLSAWNCDSWAAAGCIFGQLEDESGTPIIGASIIGEFKDHLTAIASASGADGYFCTSSAVDTSGTTLDFYTQPLTKPALFYPKFIGGLPNMQETESAFLCNDPTQCAQLGVVKINTSKPPVVDGSYVEVDGGFSAGDSGAPGSTAACTLGKDAGPVMDGGLAMTPLTGCLTGLNNVFECFSPGGGCSTTPISSTATTTKWSNGSEIQYDINGSIATGTLKGPSGTVCGGIVAGGVGGTTITDEQGNAWLFGAADAGMDAGQVVTCEPSGGSPTMVTLTPSDANTAFACTGGFGAGGGGGCPEVNPVGAPCPHGPTDCTSVASDCCMGKAGPICLPSASVCSTYQSMGCGASADCTGGDSCCEIDGAPFPLCLPESCGQVDGGVNFDDAGGTCTQSACKLTITDAVDESFSCSVSATYVSNVGTTILITASSGTFSGTAELTIPGLPSAGAVYNAGNAHMASASVSQSFDAGSDAAPVQKGWQEQFSADASPAKNMGVFQLSLTSLGPPMSSFGVTTYSCLNGMFTGTLISEQQPDGGPWAQVSVTF